MQAEPCIALVEANNSTYFILIFAGNIAHPVALFRCFTFIYQFDITPPQVISVTMRGKWSVKMI